jgi:hypothetical protein
MYTHTNVTPPNSKPIKRSNGIVPNYSIPSICFISHYATERDIGKHIAASQTKDLPWYSTRSAVIRSTTTTAMKSIITTVASSPPPRRKVGESKLGVVTIERVALSHLKKDLPWHLTKSAVMISTSMEIHLVSKLYKDVFACS